MPHASQSENRSTVVTNSIRTLKMVYIKQIFFKKLDKSHDATVFRLNNRKHRTGILERKGNRQR